MGDARDLARVLLEKAGEDEAALRALVDDPAIPDGVLGFHAQQAVEKSLKAVLTLRGVPYEFRHDIGYLSRLLTDHGEQLPSALEEADALTPWAGAFRYEDPEATPPLDRSAARDLSAAALSWARGLLSD